MAKSFLFAICLLLVSNLSSQVIYEEFNSTKLGETRQLKIQLPRNYEANTNKVYPIVLVLDGDYLFEPVAGNVDYYSYWEEMPEAIVIGIMQSGSRDRDGFYDDTNFFPTETGANFFEFIGLELIPYIDEKYRTAKFILAVGHEFTANFINYYLFKDPPLFNGYLSLSPDLAPLMETRIPEKLAMSPHKIFYYLATGSNDIKPIREITLELNKGMSGINQENIHYYFDDFEGASHYSLVGKAIPAALEEIFSIYRPISKKDYDEIILKLQTPVFDYLITKYKTIEDLFGFKTTVRENDIIAIASAAERKKEWASLEQVAKMAQKEHPDKVIGHYYLGRFFEETGEPRKAMRTYQGAYELDEVGFITIDLLLDKADKIKQDFGF
ncbi:MAG: alpha/beta hydrolase-fold protein [Flavobacteriaceae bacterium]|nr:alpha/beta hydrolase-fold protein [Flavobacteriaceae bacterium]